MDLQKSSTDDKTTPPAKVESGESVDSLGPLPPRTLSNANNDMLKVTLVHFFTFTELRLAFEYYDVC